MEQLISALGDLMFATRNMREYLRGQKWPSRTVALFAPNVIASMSVTIRRTGRLIAILEALEKEE